MGGVGSSSNYNPATGRYEVEGGGLDSFISGFGSALGELGSMASKAAQATQQSLGEAQLGKKAQDFWGQTVSAVNDPCAGQNVQQGMGSLWGKFAATAGDIAKVITEPDDTAGRGLGDGLAALRAKAAMETKQKPSRYSGFGSDSAGRGGGMGTRKVRCGGEWSECWSKATEQPLRRLPT